MCSSNLPSLNINEKIKMSLLPKHHRTIPGSGFLGVEGIHQGYTKYTGSYRFLGFLFFFFTGGILDKSLIFVLVPVPCHPLKVKKNAALQLLLGML